MRQADRDFQDIPIKDAMHCLHLQTIFWFGNHGVKNKMKASEDRNHQFLKSKEGPGETRVHVWLFRDDPKINRNQKQTTAWWLHCDRSYYLKVTENNGEEKK